MISACFTCLYNDEPFICIAAKKHCLCLILVSLVLSLSAQNTHYSLVYAPSKFLKHSKKSTFDAPEYSYMCQFTLSKQTDGSRHWQRYWGHPLVSINFSYLNFGNNDVLGQSFALFPSIRFGIVNKNEFNFGIQLGSGVAYLDRIYDKIANPLNNAVGSHWNNTTQIGLIAHTRVAANWFIINGIHFSHFSNARTATPNAGYNTAGITLGLGRTFQSKKIAEFKTTDTVLVKKCIGGDILLGYGISEYSFTGGSKYGSYFINAGASYSLSPFIKLIAGGEYEYNQSVFQFYYQDFIPANEAKRKATKTAVYAAGDFRFGLFSTRLQTGFYLPFPEGTEKASPFYFKLNFNIHPFSDDLTFRPYFGVLLKSHTAVAQYLGIVTGVSF